LCVNYVSKYTCFLFNFCIDKATFPDKFKIAKISPIYKKGPKNVIINYRPIAALCNINKLFESFLLARLTNYFASFKLLVENQFGFRKDRNTELAIFDLLNKLLPAIEATKYSACCDTLIRDVLYDELNKYGVRGNTLNLFKSYFSDRLQCVNYEYKSSYKGFQNLGVFQGSKMGPLFFDVKSEFMILTNKMIISSPDIYIGQFAVKRVKCFKYLAISIDIS